jgi:hypothetical protein
MAESLPDIAQKVSKVFFSEEKKPKTFISGGLPTRRPWPGYSHSSRIKSLWVFSSERTRFLN